MAEQQFQMVCPKCGSESFTVRRDQRAYVHKSQPFELVFSCRCGKQLFGDQIQEEYDRQKSTWESEPREEVEEVVDEEAVERAREEERRKKQLRDAMEYRRTYLAEKRRQQAEAERQRREEEDRRWREKVAKVEAEGTNERARAAAAAANGGKRVKPKPKPKPKPPPAPTPVAAPAPPTPAPVAVKPTAPATRPEPPSEVDPDHPHAEFMPYVIDGTFAGLFPDTTPPDQKDPLLCVWPPCEKNRRKKSKYCSRECSNKNARWRHKMRKKRGA